MTVPLTVLEADPPRRFSFHWAYDVASPIPLTVTFGPGQAVAKHLGVLDRVGLVHAMPAGRERRYEVDEAQLERAITQLTAVGSSWDARLRRIKRMAEAIQAELTEKES